MADERIEKIHFKHFIQKLRNIELEEAYIVINANVTTKLYEYVSALAILQFEDGWYHTYYGDIKLIINNFINYWVLILNDTIKEADWYKNTITKAKLIEIISQSKLTQKARQHFFSECYLPVQSHEEQVIYADMLKRYNQFMDTLNEMQSTVEQYDKQQQVKRFAVEQFEKSVQKKYDLMVFTHTYISKSLMKVLNRIRMSLIECQTRVNNNLEEIKAERDQNISTLMDNLYDHNKVHMALSRREHRCSLELAEVESAIEKVRNKIEHHQKTTPIPRLEDEKKYWDTKYNEFCKIKKTADKIIAEKKNIAEQEEIFKSLRCMELPGTKLDMFNDVGHKLQQAKQFYDEKYMAIAKALFTFFAVRGLNRIMYEDNVGKYTLDDYGHQIYFFDYGRKICHVTCDGNFRVVPEQEKYFYDQGGRYTRASDGEHLYQAAYCTSTYKLGEDSLLHKISEDCGHSERANKLCRMQLKDPTNIELLPTVVPVDIKGTLNAEVVHYLWDTFGQILPKTLAYLGNHCPINPIHSLGHELIQYGYSRTNEAIRKDHKEAKDYRSKVHLKRDQKAIAESVAWMLKQIQPCKPCEIDDTQEREVHGGRTKDRELVFGLNFYN